MALDQETQAFLAKVAENRGKPIHEMEPDEARALEPMMTELIGAGPQVGRVDDVELTTTDGGTFGVRTMVPDGPVRAVIVYYHGGGWVLGSVDRFDALGRSIVDRTGCAVVLPDYRKAPEHRFPAAVEDSWQALRWAAQHLDGIAGGQVPLIVAGDSAGGNLAAVVAMRARDRGGPRVSFQVLVYPVTNCDVDNRSFLEPSNQLMLNRETMIWYWDHYVPDPEMRHDPEVSPLQAPERAGLPPAVVLMAEHDVLRNEGEA
ncbi:MAG: alpha/beta hydrolase, partial [Nocardioidaceae bacterium]